MGDVHQTVLQSIVTVTKAILVKIVKLAAMILVRVLIPIAAFGGKWKGKLRISAVQVEDVHTSLLQMLAPQVGALTTIYPHP